MSKEHLVDISTRPDFKEITARGGRAKSEKKDDAAIDRGCNIIRCKNCKIKCDFKKLCLQKDPESKCLVPKLRAAAIKDGTSIVDMNDDRIKMYMDELMGWYREYCMEVPLNETEPKKIERERMRRLNTMFKRLKEFKEMWAPPVQKSVNINVTTNFDKMMERVKENREAIIINPQGGNNNGNK